MRRTGLQLLFVVGQVDTFGLSTSFQFCVYLGARSISEFMRGLVLISVVIGWHYFILHQLIEGNRSNTKYRYVMPDWLKEWLKCLPVHLYLDSTRTRTGTAPPPAEVGWLGRFCVPHTGCFIRWCDDNTYFWLQQKELLIVSLGWIKSHLLSSRSNDAVAEGVKQHHWKSLVKIF
jgi:hypothetical protein